MAQRDRSAGHAFMYVNIQDLLQQTKKIQTEENQSAPVRTETQNTHQFNQTSQQVQGNLERLQALHHKLHVMLEELNKLTGKKDS